MSLVDGKEIDQKMYQDVQNMLEKMYSKEKVPEFEVNRETIGILHQIAVKMKKDDQINKAQVDYYKNQTQVLESKCKTISESFKCAGLSLDDFPSECVAAARALGKAACVLDLKEPSETSFLLGLNHFSREKLKVSGERSKWLGKLERITQKISQTEEKVESWKKDVEATKERQKAQSSEAARRKDQSTFLQSKATEYRRRIHELEEKLKARGCEPFLYHSAIIKKYEEVQSLQKELDSLSLKLQSYQNLPPNENLVKLKVEEAKKELFDLQQELQRKIELGFKAAEPLCR